MATVDTDDASLALIEQLQREETEYVKAYVEGKQQAGDMNDGDVALQF